MLLFLHYLIDILIMYLRTLLIMFFTTKNTAVVSSTDLKRHYKEVQKLLSKNVVIVVTNRNSEDNVDGILLPYSEVILEKYEDLLEDIEMEQNQQTLTRELSKSYASGKKKRLSLESL